MKLEKEAFDKGSQKIQIVAQIKEYQFQVLWDHYFNESFDEYLQVYDATLFEIISPPEFVGKSLSAYHQPEAVRGSLWYNVGRYYKFTLEQRFLTENSYVLFAEYLESKIEEVSLYDAYQIRSRPIKTSEDPLKTD